MKTQSNIPDEIYKNIKEYRPLELDYNVHTAVENLKTAYWSNEPKKVATAFKEAEDIIISAICYDNYNVCKELQEVETERPQGEWIIRGFKQNCSNCGFTFSVDMGEDSFCPHCGAEMRGKKTMLINLIDHITEVKYTRAGHFNNDNQFAYFCNYIWHAIDHKRIKKLNKSEVIFFTENIPQEVWNKIQNIYKESLTV